MDLTKKSVSGTESKFKRIFLRFMKEIGGLKYWREYVRSRGYQEFNKNYLKKHPSRTADWWDRDYCLDILGCCNFAAYIHYYRSLAQHQKIVFERSYYLFAAFLIIFHNEEYRKYCFNKGYYSPPIEIDFKKPFEDQCESVVKYFIESDIKKMVRDWIKIKETYGN